MKRAVVKPGDRFGRLVILNETSKHGNPDLSTFLIGQQTMDILIPLLLIELMLMEIINQIIVGGLRYKINKKIKGNET